MPDHEELEKQLDAAREAKWLQSRLSRLARWPGRNRKTLRDLIRPDEPSYDEESFRQRIEMGVSYFGKLDDVQRNKLWQGVFPKLAVHLERAWCDAGNRPYQYDNARFSFRSPNREDTVAEGRSRFFVLVCDALWGLDQDAEWLAGWAPHLPSDYRDARVVGWLLSAVLRGGGTEADAVRAVLIDSINGEHEIGQMGRHVVVAFLNSQVRSDWEIIGKLLVAARRQEGLRQTILETIDEAHPAAFRYMLGVIIEHDLARFSATVRAFDVWLGMQWAGGSIKVVNAGVRLLMEFLDDETEREKVIAEGEPEDTYLALWVAAYEDAERALELATPILNESSAERRYVALRIIERLALNPESVKVPASRLISGVETDPRLQMATVELLLQFDITNASDELFKATSDFFDSIPAKKRKLDPIVWPWVQYTLDRKLVARLLRRMAKESPEKLIPYAYALESWSCAMFIDELTGKGEYWKNGIRRARKLRKIGPETRRLLLSLVGDKRQVVQKAAFEALADLPVEKDEVDVLLGLLHRAAPSLRAGAIGRLSKLSDKEAVEVIRTLISDGNSKKCAAGLELACHMIESKRSADKVRNVVREHRESICEPEQIEVADRLLGSEVETISHEDCLRLLPSGSRSTLPTPQFKGVRLETDAVGACLKSLAELFLQHGETEIEVMNDTSKSRVLLASAGWSFPHPHYGEDAQADAEKRLPLCDVWLKWLCDRPGNTRDSDGLELVRAWAWSNRGMTYIDHLPTSFRKRHAYNITQAFKSLLEWMLILSAPKGGGKLLVQYFEDALAKKSPSAQEKKEIKAHWRHIDIESMAARRLCLVEQYAEELPSDFCDDSKHRLCLNSMLAVERGLPGCELGPSLELFVSAYDAGLLKEHDLIWLLLTPREYEWNMEPRISFGPIRDVSGTRDDKNIAGHPHLREAVREVRERLIELELKRGERLTPASLPAAELRHAGGANVLFKLILGLGRDKIIRQHEWGEPSRSFSFSRLISVTYPGDVDTLSNFEKLFAASGLKPASMLNMAMFAPQWAGHVQHTLDMPGLEDAVWWIHAHTKQEAYWRDQEFRDLWAARINERTELEASDLEEGAVDVAWFRRTIDVVGADGWDRLQKPAKYASNSGGHKRAQLFADAMLSRVTIADLITRIDEKRHQDSVRALGLVPLPKKADDSQMETLLRYKRLHEFKRESHKFGSQRQASEDRAVEIGLQNLARTAGYRDPRRLQWAMEAEAVADLAQGPIAVSSDETTVTLTITTIGEPELTVVKKGRALKNVPAKLKKNEQIAQLRSRVTELRRQSSRMRQSLEDLMCRGDEFSGYELKEFFAHPMLRAMVGRLVFVGGGDLIGYPEKAGNLLRSQDGSLEAIGKGNMVRIAHPVDLWQRGDWSAWQRECFAAERVQPFKQVFREIYPKTAAESNDCDFTRRYAGHQVNQRQALALLKKRQWVAVPEEGVRKTFHDENLIAEVWFQEHFYTPADVEDLTLEGIAFVRKHAEKYERLAISRIPERLFSEAMRDLDLVVSVAHSGGVDPEASASTVEMRAALVKETCQFLRLPNVQVDGHHVRIDGKLGSYSVHLGSATTQVLPGRMLLIVAVHSQYRGRLFLPFSDDDPKTAEVLSKTLLLARDEEIKDPSILDQIRH